MHFSWDVCDSGIQISYLSTPRSNNQTADSRTTIKPMQPSASPSTAASRAPDVADARCVKQHNFMSNLKEKMATVSSLGLGTLQQSNRPALTAAVYGCHEEQSQDDHDADELRRLA